MSAESADPGLARGGAGDAPAPTPPEPVAASLDRLSFKPTFVLLTSLLFLTMLWSFGRLPFFFENLAQYVPAGQDVELWAHLYLAASSMFWRMLLPVLCIRFVLRERPRDWGYRVRGTTGLAKIYAGLLAIMLPVLYLAAQTEAFSQRYPLYSGAGASPLHFLIYEASYFLVFLSGESFWRGYMVFGLRPAFGYYAISIMAIPYVGIHWGKPAAEALGALLTAHVLGYLALKHRSFWLGVALHFSVALTMDVLALLHK